MTNFNTIVSSPLTPLPRVEGNIRNTFLQLAGVLIICFTSASAQDSTAQTAPKMFGDLYVKSVPESASVYLDGKDMQRLTPALIESLSAGEHCLQLKKESLSVNVTVTVTAGQIAKIDLRLSEPRTILNPAVMPYE